MLSSTLNSTLALDPRQKDRLELVCLKELHNQQEYYWPTIYTTGAAVVSTITSYYYY